jgi:DNA topoisomerase-3
VSNEFEFPYKNLFIDTFALILGTLGMGLVEGYELMNLQLSQPQLRAGLETDLKGICEGTKNPADVLRQQIEIYKQCYQVITRQVAALDQAVGKRFNAAPQNDNAVQNPVPAVIHDLFKCPKCKNLSMVLKQKRDQKPYIGCQGYPACTHAIWIDQNLKQISSTDEKCQSCGGQNHKVKIKFSQPYVLSQVDEVPAYSRIEAGLYITCLYCDKKAREALKIKAEDVKDVGNIVGAASNPVHNSMFNGNNNRNSNAHPQQPRPSTSSRDSGVSRTSGASTNSGGQQTSGFGSNSGNNTNNGQQRRNWFDDDNDDHRPSGGGGSISNSYNSGNNGGQQRSNWFGNDSRPSGGGPSKPAYDKSRSVLNNFPDINCKCNKKASKLVTKKEGPNQGRVFYTCDQCKLFHWADTPLPANLANQSVAGGSGSGRGGAGGSGSGRGGGGGGPRKCSVCKNTGHNRKNCPSLGH